jgi:hypothetical protein
MKNEVNLETQVRVNDDDEDGVMIISARARVDMLLRLADSGPEECQHFALRTQTI